MQRPTYFLPIARCEKTCETTVLLQTYLTETYFTRTLTAVFTKQCKYQFCFFILLFFYYFLLLHID